MYFNGTYDRNLDAKGRLSLPPAFKKQLEEHVRVLPAPEKEVDALYVFTEDTFKVWLDSVFEAKGGFIHQSLPSHGQGGSVRCGNHT